MISIDLNVRSLIANYIGMFSFQFRLHRCRGN